MTDAIVSLPQAPRPTPPVFDHVEQERDYLRRRLAAGFRLFYELGFDEGVMGHLSARDPELTDHFWLNPFAKSFATITPDDLQLVGPNGELVQGSGTVHPGAMILHPDVYAAHPDVKAIGHTHSLYGRMFSTLGRTLDPITNESAVFYGRHGLYDSHTNGEGANLAAARRSGDRALIMVNHGIVSFGATVDEMLYTFLSLEKCCQVQLTVEASAQPQILAPDVAQSIAARFTPERGWLNFQPTFEALAARYPLLADTRGKAQR